MLYSVSDFTGQYRLDTNIITQADYQQAIDEHELALLNAFFEEESVQKILSVPITAAPAAGVREAMRPLAIPFIFHRIRMGVASTQTGQPTTQGYRPAPISPRLFSQDKKISQKLSLYMPYKINQTLSTATDTFTISPADPFLPKIIAAGDKVFVLGFRMLSVVSVTSTSITVSAVMPPGSYVAHVYTLQLLRKNKYVTI